MHSLIEHRQWVTSMIDFTTAMGSLLSELFTTPFTNFKCSTTFGVVSLLFNLELFDLLVRDYTEKHGFDNP